MFEHNDQTGGIAQTRASLIVGVMLLLLGIVVWLIVGTM